MQSSLKGTNTFALKREGRKLQFVFGDMAPVLIGLAIGITLVAGFVKGAVGFALPMIMISGLSAFLPPEIALAALIVPTVLANVWQALRGGIAAAITSVGKFRTYIAVVLLFIALSSQLVTILPGRALFLILGVPITALSLMQLTGWRLPLRTQHRRRNEVLIGAFAGFMGGVSGVWGPPTVAYLTAIETPKTEQVRVQGVVYGAGALLLFFAHLKSGVLNGETLPLSLAMVVPTIVGMVLGFWVQDRLDQQKFRFFTLLLLVVAGLNLIRRGVLG